MIDSEAASIFEQFIRSGKVDQLADQGQIAGLKAAMNYSALDYLKAMRVRTQIQEAFRTLFADLDVLVAPTKLDLADRADQPFDETPPKRPEQKGVVAGLVQASNLCGLPAISVPCGFVNGLPVGLQFVGRRFPRIGSWPSRTNFSNGRVSTSSIPIWARQPENPKAPAPPTSAKVTRKTSTTAFLFQLGKTA